jgi:DnaJ-class molecular chaperone
MNSTTDIDPKLAQDIEAEMAEIDGRAPERKSTKSSVESEACDCTGLSPEGTPGTGLLDDHTQCPKCEGTGKLAVLK